MEKLFINSESLIEDSFKLAWQVYEDGYRPNYIIGVWRGGTPIGIAVQEFFSVLGVPSDHIAIRTSHYKGIDERIREHFVTLELSIGDYVLSGGEIAAAVLTDALIRLIPGVIGDETSALTDSFQDGLLAPPVYTRPADFNGWKTPEVLLSGNHEEIRKWEEEQALKRTKKRRPDLLDR